MVIATVYFKKMFDKMQLTNNGPQHLFKLKNFLVFWAKNLQKLVNYSLTLIYDALIFYSLYIEYKNLHADRPKST